MGIGIQFFFLLMILAFVCEYLDASLGMGYGTILAPILLVTGFDPHLVVPSVLISQALAGLIASIFHHRYRNVRYSWSSNDLKIVIMIVIAGALATVVATIISINVSKFVLSLYIGILITIVGIILLSKYHFTFSWTKIFILGVISAFNKGISGGGFGPLVTGGQVISGQNERAAIGVTTLAEVFICLISFSIYCANKNFNWQLAMPLIVGAISVAPFAAKTTANINPQKMRILLGSLIVTLGAMTTFKVILKG